MSKLYKVGPAVLALAMAATACGSSTANKASRSNSSGASTEKPAAATPILTTPAGSIGTDWVTYNKKTCKFEPAATHPDTWTAILRKPTQPMVLGFGEQGEGNPLLDAFNANMKEDAAKAGITLAIGNYDTLTSSDKVLPQAQAIALRKPNVVVSYNNLTSTIPAVNALYENECAAIIQITAPAPNAVVFGASNADVGKTEGDYLSKYAKNKGWDPSSVTVLGLQDQALGASIGERVSGCQAAVQAAMPGVSVANIANVNSTSADSQIKTTDWLTAHPSAHHVLVCTVSDIFAIGANSAFKGANRVADGAIMGAGGGSDGIAVIKENQSMVGSINFAFDHYADYVIPLAEDIMDGQAVPTEVHQQLTVLDRTNVS